MLLRPWSLCGHGLRAWSWQKATRCQSCPMQSGSSGVDEVLRLTAELCLAVWWRQVDGLRPDLRQLGRGQEVRAQVPAGSGGHWTGYAWTRILQWLLLISTWSLWYLRYLHIPDLRPATDDTLFLAAERPGHAGAAVAQEHEGAEEPRQEVARLQEVGGHCQEVISWLSGGQQGFWGVASCCAVSTAHCL